MGTFSFDLKQTLIKLPPLQQRLLSHIASALFVITSSSSSVCYHLSLQQCLLSHITSALFIITCRSSSVCYDISLLPVCYHLSLHQCLLSHITYALFVNTCRSSSVCYELSLQQCLWSSAAIELFPLLMWQYDNTTCSCCRVISPSYVAIWQHHVQLLSSYFPSLCGNMTTPCAAAVELFPLLPWVAAQAVRWPGALKIARSHLSQCSKSCHLQPALNWAIRGAQGVLPCVGWGVRPVN